MLRAGGQRRLHAGDRLSVGKRLLCRRVSAESVHGGRTCSFLRSEPQAVNCGCV